MCHSKYFIIFHSQYFASFVVDSVTLRNTAKPPKPVSDVWKFTQTKPKTALKNQEIVGIATKPTTKPGTGIRPETTAQREIKRLMTTQRLTFKEAERRLDGKFGIKLDQRGRRLFNINNHADFPFLPGTSAKSIQNEGPAQQLLREWQDPNSNINKLEKLTHCKSQYKNLIGKIIKTLTAINPNDEFINDIKKMVNLIESSPEELRALLTTNE